jgi:N-acetyl-alpha-D-glucosaminyl L-malate synthase BshA
LEDVIKTFYLIQKEIPAKLLLCGDGPDRAKAEHLGRELNICQKIKFIGKVRDAGSILQLSDLFLLPSETESFGLAALEAMAEGVPVVSSNTGGIPEVNVHGVSGYLSNVGDVEDMAKHSLEILRDTKTLEQFRQAALTRASEFKLEKVLPVYEELYEQVVKSVKV